MIPSKTQTINVLKMILLVLTAILGHEWISDNPQLTMYIGMVITAIDTYVRTLTSQPTKYIFMKEKQ